MQLARGLIFVSIAWLRSGVCFLYAGDSIVRGRHIIKVKEAEKEEGVTLDESTKKNEEVGVDIWGEPVTASDMMPVEEEGKEEEAGPVYTAKDFTGSEWKIGVLWREKEKVEVTWFRCKEDLSSEWGWGAEGKWKIDEGAFFTVSRDFPLGWNGRRLFSAKIGDDPNYLEGIIRGWKPWEPASVMGSWQAIRLGVNRTNPPPWQNRQEEEDEDDDQTTMTELEEEEKEEEGKEEEKDKEA